MEICILGISFFCDREREITNIYRARSFLTAFTLFTANLRRMFTLFSLQHFAIRNTDRSVEIVVTHMNARQMMFLGIENIHRDQNTVERGAKGLRAFAQSRLSAGLAATLRDVLQAIP